MRRTSASTATRRRTTACSIAQRRRRPSPPARRPAADMTAALARVAVVIPVGPGDRVAPALVAQLAQAPALGETIVVHAAGEVPHAPATAAEAQPAHWRVVSAAR